MQVDSVWCAEVPSDWDTSACSTDSGIAKKCAVDVAVINLFANGGPLGWLPWAWLARSCILVSSGLEGAEKLGIVGIRLSDALARWLDVDQPDPVDHPLLDLLAGWRLCLFGCLASSTVWRGSGIWLEGC